MAVISFQFAAVLLIVALASAQQYGDQPQRGRGAYEGPGGNFGGKLGAGQRGSFGAGGLEDRDANGERYAARIYMEPEYYGYESNFPGGKANFKSYRSAPEGGPHGFGLGGQGGNYDSVAVGARGSNRYAPSGGASRSQF